jgi:surface antigen
MFNAKVSAVKSLMVVGKLLTLLAISPALANDLNEPRFFEYQSGGFINRLGDLSFGWFKTLDDEQKDAYHQSINHAIMMAENGKAVRWYRKNASGYAVPVMTWPNNNGYCRRVHIQAIAYGVEKTMAATACYDDINNRWQWIKG